MADVKVNAHNPVEVRRVFESMQADLAALRAAFVTLTAKMDADFADVTNASVDYATSCDPAALETTNE